MTGPQSHSRSQLTKTFTARVMYLSKQYHLKPQNHISRCPSQKRRSINGKQTATTPVWVSKPTCSTNTYSRSVSFYRNYKGRFSNPMLSILQTQRNQAQNYSRMTSKTTWQNVPSPWASSSLPRSLEYFLRKISCVGFWDGSMNQVHKSLFPTWCRSSWRPWCTIASSSRCLWPGTSLSIWPRAHSFWYLSSGIRPSRSSPIASWRMSSPPAKINASLSPISWDSIPSRSCWSSRTTSTIPSTKKPRKSGGRSSRKGLIKERGWRVHSARRLRSVVRRNRCNDSLCS